MPLVGICLSCFARTGGYTFVDNNNKSHVCVQSFGAKVTKHKCACSHRILGAHVYYIVVIHPKTALTSKNYSLDQPLYDVLMIKCCGDNYECNSRAVYNIRGKGSYNLQGIYGLLCGVKLANLLPFRVQMRPTRSWAEKVLRLYRNFPSGLSSIITPLSNTRLIPHHSFWQR